MSASLKWDGMAELRAELRKLPADLAAEAGGIILHVAEAARAEIDAAYPEVTGNLKRGLRLKNAAAGRFGAGVLLRNSAKHAWLYDHGSQARHYVTKGGNTHGTGKMWGRTGPTHVFVRSVVKRKRQMMALLKDLLVRHGATVTGDA